MIKDIEKIETLKLTIVMESGEVFSKKDTTSNSFGQDGMVSIWVDDVVRMLPLRSVKYIDFHTDLAE